MARTNVQDTPSLRHDIEPGARSQEPGARSQEPGARGRWLRLNRYCPEQPFQNFYDLFLSNYRLRPGLPADAPRLIENMPNACSICRSSRCTFISRHSVDGVLR
jgi:hypothetical protein